MEIKANRTYYYALVKNGALDDLDDAILDMVLYVMCKKNYTTIITNDICEDFHKIIGFKLPYFPMNNILSKANKMGLIDYNNKSKEYIPNYTAIKKESIMDIVNDSEKKFNELIRGLQVYLKTSENADISRQEAEDIINSFIEEQGFLFLENKDIYCKNPHEDYLFAQYLYQLYASDDGMLDYINNLIIGRIFSELVLYSEGLPSQNSFENTTAYLDTGFVFRLLGVDGIDRQSVYKDLIEKMHEAGIKTKMYFHSYNEMIGIVNNSEQWLQNPNYDPAVSNEATDYFVNNGFRKNDIQDFIVKIKEDLTSYNIELEDFDYPQIIPAGVQSEKEYYDAIVSYYKDKSSAFDEDEKRQTVEYDARSFFYTNYLSKGIMVNNWFDIKYIFVTTNRSLPIVAKRMITNSNNSKNVIPFCISDSFLGVMLWRNSPETVVQKSYNRLISSMYAAFQPSDALLKKLSETVKKCQDSGDLTAEQCYLLKTSKEAQKQLMRLTQGDVNAFTERTPLEILQEMHEESVEMGREEERKKADIKIAEIQADLNFEKESNKKLENRDVDRRIEAIGLKCRNYESEKKHIEEKLDNLNKYQLQVNKKVKRDAIVVVSVFWLLMIVSAVITYVVWKESGHSDYIGAISFVVPASYTLVCYSYFAITEKDISIKHAIQAFKKNRVSKYWEIYNMNPEQKKDMEYQLSNLKKDIDNCKKDAEALLELRN